MRHRLAAVLLAGALAGALVGCGGGASDPDDDSTTLQPTTDAPEPTDSPEPTGSSEPTESATPPTNVQEAIEDLADELGVDPAAIQAGPLEQVTWSDGSLGCPEPGMSYPQVLTDGYRVTLTAEGEEYAYHAGEDGELFHCTDPVDPVSDDTQES